VPYFWTPMRMVVGSAARAPPRVIAINTTIAEWINFIEISSGASSLDEAVHRFGREDGL
jgi:hypothetical protein